MSSGSRKRVYCSVYGCLKNSNQNPELSFFRIPKDPERRRQWLQIISREDLIDKLTANRVCELHFKALDILKSARKSLKSNSLPCLNLPLTTTGDKQTDTETLVELNDTSSQTDTAAGIMSKNVTVNNTSSQTDTAAGIMSKNVTVNNTSSQTDTAADIMSKNVTVNNTSSQTDTAAGIMSKNVTVNNTSSQTDMAAGIMSENVTVNNTSSQTDRIVSITSENITQTETSLSANTPRKRKLKSNLQDCRKRLKVLETERTGTKSQQDMFYKLCDRFLSKDLSELVKAQIRLKSSHNGNRYTLAYKMFCLNLYYVSPQAYRLLEKTICLPSKVTLSKLYVPISTEVSEGLMEALKIKVNKMSDAEKHCTLVMDAMSLKTNLFYDIKNDKIIGFHEVDGKQSPSPAKNALVVLIRGIFVKWSQPVGFSLISECKNDSHISNWIDKITSKLIEIGLKIRAFVSDLGSDLLNGAKKRGISTDTTYFTVNGHKIYYIFDAPHLIKLVRNNLMTYDFHFHNGAVAKFEHIVKFYEFDHKKTFRQAHKLTNSHINPSNFEKMKVRYATQLLSRSVASGLSTCVDFNVIDESAKHTVEFIKMMNDLFDALNSSTFCHSYKHKSAFHGDESQIDFFKKMLAFFQKLKLINSKKGNDGKKGVKFIQGFQITIQSILHLHEDLKQEGYEYLLTRRLNQDVIENFFGKIRSQNGRASEPTSRQFISAFRKIYFANLNRPPKEGNCVEDLSEFLVHLEDFETRWNDGTDVFDPPNIDEQENNLSEISRSDYVQFDISEKNAFFYVCGALLKKCIEHHKDCDLLKLYMSVHEQACNLNVESRYLSYRNYATDRNLLVVPPDDFVKYIERLEQVFFNAFQKEHINCKIGSSIYEQMKKIEFSLPCPCFPKQYLLKLYIRMRIYYTLKSNNQAFRTSRNRRKYFSVSNL